MKKVIVVLCILWVGFIFYNSSNVGKISNSRSYSIVNFMKKSYVKIVKPEENIIKYSDAPISKRDVMLNVFVRKDAHFFEYFVLAVLVSGVFYRFGYRNNGSLIYVFFACLFCAVLDEFYQYFIPGRSSSVVDVLIDFLGSVIGTSLFSFLLYKTYRKTTIGKSI